MSDLNISKNQSPSTAHTRAPPTIADALPWLPPDHRLQVLRSFSIQWNDLRAKPDGEILRAATIIDDQAIARWILEESKQASGAIRQIWLRSAPCCFAHCSVLMPTIWNRLFPPPNCRTKILWR